VGRWDVNPLKSSFATVCSEKKSDVYFHLLFGHFSQKMTILQKQEFIREILFSDTLKRP
jgi:hypothetical protein